MQHLMLDHVGVLGECFLAAGALVGLESWKLQKASIIN